MAIDRAARNRWTSKIERLATAAAKAQEELLVCIAEASEAGVTNADIAYNLIDSAPGAVAAGWDKGTSPSGVGKKVEQGKAILARRAGE